MQKYIFFGLGNPGLEYSTTRHNIGFRVIDAFVEKVDFFEEKVNSDFICYRGRLKGRSIILVKPLTYMNLSGLAVERAMKELKLTAESICVIADEIQFELGVVKLHGSGGSGGHNGLSSIISTLGTNRFYRMRCGIGSDFGGKPIHEHVLSPFPESEKEAIEGMIQKAVSALELVIERGFTNAMGVVNAE